MTSNLRRNCVGLIAKFKVCCRFKPHYKLVVNWKSEISILFLTTNSMADVKLWTSLSRRNFSKIKLSVRIRPKRIFLLQPFEDTLYLKVRHLRVILAYFPYLKNKMRPIRTPLSACVRVCARERLEVNFLNYLFSGRDSLHEVGCVYRAKWGNLNALIHKTNQSLIPTLHILDLLRNCHIDINFIHTIFHQSSFQRRK
jgi:hypothetical protein